MIEIIVRDFMSSAISVPVYMEIPANFPESFVVIRKSDTSRENRIHTATFVVESYAPTLMAAAELNETVKSALDDLVDLPKVSASKLATDYPFPDTTIEKYRYQAVYTITHY